MRYAILAELSPNRECAYGPFTTVWEAKEWAKLYITCPYRVINFAGINEI